MKKKKESMELATLRIVLRKDRKADFFCEKDGKSDFSLLHGNELYYAAKALEHMCGMMGILFIKEQVKEGKMSEEEANKLLGK